MTTRRATRHAAGPEGAGPSAGMPTRATYWQRVHHADPRALDMADRHYSRQSPGTPEFMPSGNKIVLMHFAEDGSPAALWGWHRPAPGKAVRADGRDAWACTMFRVEQRTVLASVLICEAVSVALGLWRPLPADGLYTTVNPAKVPPTKVRGRDVWGWTYIKAGWRVEDARTKDKDLVIVSLPLAALQLLPPVVAPLNLPPFGMPWRRWPRAVVAQQESLL